MEFFRIVDISTEESEIQRTFNLNNLEYFTNLLIPLGEPGDGSIDIGGLWGEFTLLRSEIEGGVRFALKECPNALAWTITTGYPPSENGIVIHLTINRTEKDQQFIDEIDEFLTDKVDQISINLPLNHWVDS